MYTTAMKAQENVKDKLQLLEVSKSFAAELDQHTLIMTIIEKTREILDADREYIAEYSTCSRKERAS